MAGYSNLTRGLNLWGHSASVGMQPGECLDGQDVQFRLDGSFQRHPGYRKINATAFSGRVVGHKSFTYKGKNNTTPANHPGNFGIANDAGSSTPSRRVDFYQTAVLVTANNEIRFWNPATRTYDLPTLNINGRGAGVWLPTGITTLPMSPKPSFEVHNENLYIVGMGANLRYDPVDRGLYRWGWESAPSLTPVVAYNAASSDLIVGATYKYRASWVDLYTGEESELSAERSFTISAALDGIDFGGAPASGVNLANYAGDRHWAPAGDLADSDVGIAIYRTLADGEKFYFLGLIYPNTATATTWSDGTTLVDTGLAPDTSLPATTRDYQDPPTLNTFAQSMDMWWGTSWDEDWTRLYYCDFEGENSFWERWDPRQYISLPLSKGEYISAIEPTNKSLLVMSPDNAVEVSPFPTETGRIAKTIRPLYWEVGCIGPKAKRTIGGSVYFLSKRGPYRWMPGMQKPEWIGRQILPLFIDTESDLCQLNPGGMLEAEVEYDWASDVARMLFTCGAATTANRHLTYSVRASEMNGDPATAFMFMSPNAQCFDYGSVLTGLGADGSPLRPWERKERFIFGDELGYVYEYDPALGTAGLYGVSALTGAVQAGSTQASIVTLGGLLVGGTGNIRGLQGCWVEIEYSDGTSEMRKIDQNTATTITPTVPFSQSPLSGTWYVGGYPAFWESWVDHMGDPHSHKKIRHMAFGFNMEEGGLGSLIDFEIKASSQWPSATAKEHTARLNLYREKVLVNLIGVFFTYRFSNTKPNQKWMISNFDYGEGLEMLQRRRRR